MTKRQRAQVVELLRSSADVLRVHGRVAAALEIQDLPREMQSLCFNAEWDTGRDLGVDLWVVSESFGAHADVLLEAAARVEEGSWP